MVLQMHLWRSWGCGSSSRDLFSNLVSHSSSFSSSFHFVVVRNPKKHPYLVSSSDKRTLISRRSKGFFFKKNSGNNVSPRPCQKSLSSIDFLFSVAETILSLPPNEDRLKEKGEKEEEEEEAVKLWA